MTTAALYLRISDDRDGRGLGIARQRQDTRRLAEAIGADRVLEYADNDRSATSGKPRPEFLRMLADVRTGVLGPGDVIVGYNQDRLVREPAELEHLMATCRATGVGLRTTTGEINTRTADGRTHARLIGAMALGETEKAAERISRAMAQNAANGKPHGRRAYGWDRVATLDNAGNRTDVRDVVNPAEAAVVAEVATRLIAGETVLGVARDLNARGVPTPSGKPWVASTVRGVVTRERNIAKRVHKGATFDGEWDPILDADTYARVVALLADPTRRVTPGNQPRHLLSHIARCGVCGGPMVATGRTAAGVYRCPRHVQRARGPVDEHVLHIVEAWLDSDDAREMLAALGDDKTHAALQEAEALEAKLNGAADDFAADVLTRDQLARITARLRPMLDAARGRATITRDRPVWVDQVGRGGDFTSLPLDRQRAIVRALFTVTVLPVSVRGRAGFDASSVRVEPRSDVD